MDTFANMDLPLDRRITKAVMKCGFVKPTTVQSKCLPLALEGKDLMVKARTGSGKTLAYCLPVLNKVLDMKSEDPKSTGIRAVILVPTRELVSQVHQQLKELVYYCKDMVSVAALSNEKSSIHEAWLKLLPDIVVATPGKLAAHLKTLSQTLKLKESVVSPVVDEADLVFSYGYSDDVSFIVSHLPKTCQSFLMSATLNADVVALKKLILHSPVVVKIEETNTDGTLTQWYVELNKSLDKDLLLYALLRLKLISGKTLFFVNSVNACYRMKLLLEQFHVKAAVLNSELPLNSRLHIMEDFNKGMFDFLIATDESLNVEEDNVNENSDSEENDDSESSMEKDEPKPKKRASKASTQPASKKRKADDDEFGVARGIDFRGVNTVINLDFPLSHQSYTHRIGRTARGGANGTALSIVCLDSVEEVDVLEKVQENQAHVNDAAQPALLALDMKEIESFRYRVEDVRRAVTTRGIREARMKEIRQETINSDRLKAHFADNPNDLSLLKHDSVLRPAKVVPHLAHVPDYLLPKNLQNSDISKQLHVKFADSTSGRKLWKKNNRKGEFRSKTSQNARASRMSNQTKKRLAKNNPLF